MPPCWLHGKEEGREDEVLDAGRVQPGDGACVKLELSGRVSDHVLARLREGECLALQPADILPSKVARVEKTHHRRKGEDKNGPPKTDNSYRDTSMPDFLYDEVLRYIDALCDIREHDRIFYFQKGTLGRALTEAANAAGVKRIRIHDLRHSHAALLVELGYSIVAVAERLGDTVEVAMSTYSHLYPNKMEAIVADLNKQADGKSEESPSVISELEKVEKEHKN